MIEVPITTPLILHLLYKYIKCQSNNLDGYFKYSCCFSFFFFLAALVECAMCELNNWSGTGFISDALSDITLFLSRGEAGTNGALQHQWLGTGHWLWRESGPCTSLLRSLLLSHQYLTPVKYLEHSTSCISTGSCIISISWMTRDMIF